MNKLFLVLHIYESIDPSVYLVEEKNLKDFIEKSERRQVRVYEWDMERLMSSMQEIEVEYIVNIKKINNEHK